MAKMLEQLKLKEEDVSLPILVEAGQDKSVQSAKRGRKSQVDVSEIPEFVKGPTKKLKISAETAVANIFSFGLNNKFTSSMGDLHEDVTNNIAAAGRMSGNFLEQGLAGHLKFKRDNIVSYHNEDLGEKFHDFCADAKKKFVGAPARNVEKAFELLVSKETTVKQMESDLVAYANILLDRCEDSFGQEEKVFPGKKFALDAEE